MTPCSTSRRWRPLREIPGLLERCVHESQAAAVRDVADRLTACAATPGSYLWFIGD
ncbi:hypothetical protein [Kitasatospora cheerisanensis]|uniref:hypothetical protein n=1 Tax=Kitasatospora cheerisanensis TaxID=81942 RepID=UPI000A43A7B6|nr:hypothetical protein [Kitasatospora cheerisanensis]